MVAVVTGYGFDHATLEARFSDTTLYHGRGFMPVRSLCDSLNFGIGGREISASSRWYFPK